MEGGFAGRGLRGDTYEFHHISGRWLGSRISTCLLTARDAVPLYVVPVDDGTYLLGIEIAIFHVDALWSHVVELYRTREMNVERLVHILSTSIYFSQSPMNSLSLALPLSLYESVHRCTRV